MRRTATVLSGSACCVYGLTFTSHFYGAKRTVGYVPFDSETLVTGKLFEDIREAVHKLADPALYDTVIVTNLCVPTASGVPLQLLPKQINGVRIIGIDVPGFGVPTHAEAKDVLAGAMLRYARTRSRTGAGAGARHPVRPPHHHPARRDVPRRSGRHRHDAGAHGPGRRPRRPHPRMARAVRRPRLRGGGGDPPPLHRQPARVRRRRPQGGGLGARGPRRHGRVARRHRRRLRGRAAADRCGQEQGAGRHRRRARRQADQGTYHRLGLRGLRAAGRAPADRKRGGSALCRHRLPADRLVRTRPCVAGCARLPRAVPRLAGAGPRRLRGARPRPRHRHHARGAARQAEIGPGALLHQPDFRPAADGGGRRRLAGHRGQRGAGQQGPLRAHERLLRGRGRRRHGRRLGRHPRSRAPSSRPATPRRKAALRAQEEAVGT